MADTPEEDDLSDLPDANRTLGDNKKSISKLDTPGNEDPESIKNTEDAEYTEDTVFFTDYYEEDESEETEKPVEPSVTEPKAAKPILTKPVKSQLINKKRKPWKKVLVIVGVALLLSGGGLYYRLNYYSFSKIEKQQDVAKPVESEPIIVKQDEKEKPIPLLKGDFYKFIPDKWELSSKGQYQYYNSKTKATCSISVDELEISVAAATIDIGNGKLVHEDQLTRFTLTDSISESYNLEVEYFRKISGNNSVELEEVSDEKGEKDYPGFNENCGKISHIPDVEIRNRWSNVQF